MSPIRSNDAGSQYMQQMHTQGNAQNMTAQVSLGGIQGRKLFLCFLMISHLFLCLDPYPPSTTQLTTQGGVNVSTGGSDAISKMFAPSAPQQQQQMGGINQGYVGQGNMMGGGMQGQGMQGGMGMQGGICLLYTSDAADE